MARHPELLIPASSLEVLKTAVVFGADAVYIGGEAFGLRAKAKNFSKEDMMEGIRFAHEHDVKVYVTANILAHNYDLEGVREYFKELKEIKPDALIIADPGVFEIAKEVCPEIERHVSTQANNTNYATYMFWYRQGASRVVSARELSMREIKEIRAHIPDDLEIETFVHGAMCISYSGRCLLSNFFTELKIYVPLSFLQTMAHAPIRAAGNILLWKKPVRENICRFMKMREERIFSIQKTSV